MGENNGSDSTGRIKTLLSQNPKGLGITEISRRLNMHRNVVAKYLEMLRVSGLAEMSLVGKTKIYTVSHRTPISIISAFPDTPIIILDENGRILQVNNAFSTISGTSIEDLIGKDIQGSNLPFVSQLNIDSLLENQGTQEKLIQPLLHPGTNRMHYFDVRAFSIALEPGNPGVIVTSLDITREIELNQRLVAAESAKKSIVDHQHYMICRFLPDFTITFTNQAFRDRFSVPLSDTYAINFLETVSPIDKNEIACLVEPGGTMQSPVVQEYPVQSHINEKGVQWQRWRYTPIYGDSGDLIEVQALGRDITREKDLGEKIDQHALDLEFISRKAMDFVELPPETDIYEVIGESARFLVPEAVVSVSSFDDATDSITVRSFLGDDDKVFARYFRNMIGLKMPILDKEIIALIASGTLHKVPGGVYISTFGQIPVFPSEKIERDLPLKCTYSIGLAANGSLLCVVTMFMNGGDSIKNPDLFVAYMRQATMALQRRRVENKLVS